jgi:hypothetical protein
MPGGWLSSRVIHWLSGSGPVSALFQLALLGAPAEHLAGQIAGRNKPGCTERFNLSQRAGVRICRRRVAPWTISCRASRRDRPARCHP